MAEKIGTLYFIEAEGTGMMKVGFSVDPRQRLHSMQSGTPGKLTMRGSVNATPDAEKALHAIHKAHRVRGEWYPVEYAMGIYDDLGEACEAVSADDMGSVVVTREMIERGNLTLA